VDPRIFPSLGQWNISTNKGNQGSKELHVEDCSPNLAIAEPTDSHHLKGATHKHFAADGEDGFDIESVQGIARFRIAFQTGVK
jgi:hypothetical protein